MAIKQSRYYQVKQSISDYHMNQMLHDDIIIPINFPLDSPVILCQRNYKKSPDDPKAWIFAINYRK